MRPRIATAAHAFPTLLRNNPPTDAPPKPQAQHFNRLCWVDIQRNLGHTIHWFVSYHLLFHNSRLFPYGSAAYESSTERPGSARRNLGATVCNGRVRGRRRRQPPSGLSGNHSAANIGCKSHCRIRRLLNWHSFRRLLESKIRSGARAIVWSAASRPCENSRASTTCANRLRVRHCSV